MSDIAGVGRNKHGFAREFCLAVPNQIRMAMAESTPEDSRKTVLLIDDSFEFRTLIRIELERTGQLVVVGEAQEGVEGIRKAIELEPDVVMLDLQMPGMDGWRALPLLRKVLPPTSKIFVLSAADDVDEEELLAKGAAGYASKMHSFPGLLESVSYVLRGDSDD